MANIDQGMSANLQPQEDGSDGDGDVVGDGEFALAGGYGYRAPEPGDPALDAVALAIGNSIDADIPVRLGLP